MFYALKKTDEKVCFINEKNQKVKCIIRMPEKFKEEINKIIKTDFKNN